MNRNKNAKRLYWSSFSIMSTKFPQTTIRSDPYTIIFNHPQQFYIDELFYHLSFFPLPLSLSPNPLFLFIISTTTIIISTSKFSDLLHQLQRYFLSRFPLVDLLEIKQESIRNLLGAPPAFWSDSENGSAFKRRASRTA